MQKITTVLELKAAIAVLELKQETEGELLKDQFKLTYENLKPINLIKNTFHDLLSSKEIKQDLLSETISMVIGFASKKIVFGNSHNPIKQFVGALLQTGVANLASKNSEGIKGYIMRLYNSYSSKNDTSIS